jgi:Family of unknown function (DUF5677)
VSTQPDKGNIDNIREACGLLIQLGEEIVQSLNQVNPKTKRVRLFQLSILRAIRIAQASLVLDDGGFVEEVLALTRTLAEVVINACYLQIANDQEIESFGVFDIQKSFRMSENLAKKMDAADIISDEKRTELEAIVAQARVKSQRRDKDISWSTDHIGLRAEKLDATLVQGNAMFALLNDSTYEFAHPFVHGTYQSYSAVRRLMAEGAFPSDEDRMVQRIQAMGGANQCLLALCAYAHIKFNLPIASRIQEASRINLEP